MISDDTANWLQLFALLGVVAALYAIALMLKARGRRVRAFSERFNMIVVNAGVTTRQRIPADVVVTQATALARERAFDWTEKPFTDALYARLEALERTGAFESFQQAQASGIAEIKRSQDAKKAFASERDADPLNAVVDGVVHRIDPTPDGPMSWGAYKGNWYAYRSDDVEATLTHLGATVIKRANWTSGTALARMEHSPWTFVPPAIGGWVVVVGNEFLPTYNDTAMDRWMSRFAALSQHFGEVQFFASHRVSGSVQHAKAVNGSIVRIFDSQDGQIKEWGDATETELALGYARWQRFKSDDQHEWQPGDPANVGFASEQLPFVIASGWSVDPGQYDKMGLPPSVGYLMKF